MIMKKWQKEQGLPGQKQPGRPRGVLREPSHTLTVRIRRLIDIAHEGKVRDASRLTGIPYPTVNDLYTGRSSNPNLATLETLRAPYDIDIAWLISPAEPQETPRTGMIVFLPPDPNADLKRRALRQVQIPFVAWSMYEVFSSLAVRLSAMKATAERPIVAEASGDALLFRLATFLFQPLLAAEKAGEKDVFPTWAQGSDLEEKKKWRWANTLEALGRMWIAIMPGIVAERGVESEAVQRS